MTSIFIGAIVFSIWCVTLFFGKKVGLSAFLFAVPLTIFIIAILEKNKKIVNKKAILLVIPIALLSSTYFIFNNSFFNALNFFVIPVLIIVMILRLFGEEFKIKLNFVLEMFAVVFSPLGNVKSAFENLGDTINKKFKVNINSENKGKIKKVIKAVLITLPIAIVIIALLSSADANFANIFRSIGSVIGNALGEIEISNVFARIILIFCAFVYLMCFLDYIVLRYKRKVQEEEDFKKKHEDNFTIKMILGVLNVVYLIFCVLQIKALFEVSDSLNLSHFAREGFFQLMAVSLINLVMLLIAKKSENEEEKKSNRYINTMCVIMVVFTLIILISAVLRMYLYENAFGYTLLRLLVYCSLFAEAVLLIPTVLYILDRKVSLTKSYFAILLTVYICMNFANFDYIIAKRNVDRYVETGKIDIDYLVENTGTDATYQLIRVIERKS